MDRDQQSKYSTMTLKALKDVLRERNLAVSGKKQALINR